MLRFSLSYVLEFWRLGLGFGVKRRDMILLKYPHVPLSNPSLLYEQTGWRGLQVARERG